jgi:hypothetical protein
LVEKALLQYAKSHWAEKMLKEGKKQATFLIEQVGKGDKAKVQVVES